MIFFSYNLPTGTSSSVYFFLKFVLKFYFVKHYFSPLNTFFGKGKDPEPEPDPGGHADPPDLVPYPDP